MTEHEGLEIGLHEPVWEEDDLIGACELCGDHWGVRCTVPGCYETVDFVWEKDPRG